MRPSKKNKSRGKQWTVIPSPVIPDWEATHIFLEVARCGSFRAAAQKLGQSVNALRRKIDRLEKELEVSLLSRHVNGVQLTEEGSRIFAAARQMENASFELLQARGLSEKQAEGEVRLSISEGMGSGWLMTQLPEFLHANPKLVLNLRCGPPADLQRLEADIAVQLQRPKEPDLKVVRLGRLHVMFFAARSYLETYGIPTSLADLAKHRIVVLADDAGNWEEGYRRVFPDVSPAAMVVLRNNLSSTHFYSVAQGVGIGVLATYAQGVGADLVPLDFDIDSKYDIWLTYRPEAKKIARIRKTIDWIIQAYNPRRYPWFRDDFLHPNRFAEVYKGAPPKSSLVSARNRRR